MPNKDLITHAARCSRLADTCKDEAVASKFRELARGYITLAQQAPDQTLAGIEDPQLINLTPADRG
jgi:hypothetical protein